MRNERNTGRDQHEPTGMVVPRRSLLGVSAGAVAIGRLARLAGMVGAGTGIAAMFAARAEAQPQGNSRLYEILKRKTLVVGTGTGNPPWHFQDENGNFAGFDISLARFLALALFNDPTKVEFQIQPPDARIPSLLADKVDIVFQFMTITALRAQQVEFSIPYYREGQGLLITKDSKHRDYKGLLAAGTNVKISILQNVEAEDNVHTALPKAQVVTLDTTANTIQALDSRRVDAAAVNQSTVRWLSLKFPNKYKDSGKGWYPQLYSAAMKPGDGTWRTYVDTVLATGMGGIGWKYYKEEYTKYFGVNLPDPPIGFPVEARMDQALGLIHTP